MTNFGFAHEVENAINEAMGIVLTGLTQEQSPSWRLPDINTLKTWKQQVSSFNLSTDSSDGTCEALLVNPALPHLQLKLVVTMTRGTFADWFPKKVEAVMAGEDQELVFEYEYVDSEWLCRVINLGLVEDFFGRV